MGKGNNPRKRLSKNVLEMKRNGKKGRCDEGKGMTIAYQESVEDNPWCAHGPTILFRSGSREFFACSASRDRKGCGFFHQGTEKISPEKRIRWKQLLESEKLDRLPDGKRFRFCHTCSRLFPESEHHDDQGHLLTPELSRKDLNYPTKILTPLNMPKKEAQFHFSEETLSVLSDTFRRNGIKKVICIGAPGLHEFLVSSSKLMTILLDIDRRLPQFYPAGQVCRYNIFNNFFFGESSRQYFLDFIDTQRRSGGSWMIVTDPPFGGKCNLIAGTLLRIKDEVEKRTMEPVDVTWIFPYFMGAQVKNEMPFIQMSDYQVNYREGVSYKQGVICNNQPKRKKGSPVRIFTSVNLRTIDLSSLPERYKHCSECKVWVHIDNQHCRKCKACTSKNGGTYQHCDVCARCVKSTWRHCRDCNRCCLPRHPCDLFRSKQED